MSERAPILQPGTGPIRAAEYLPADPAAVLWGESPCEADDWVLSVASGTEVTIDTISHEGILGDQGRDPVAYFGGHGVPRDHVLDDAIALAASAREHDPARVGPHVLTGPIRVEGARPGEGGRGRAKAPPPVRARARGRRCQTAAFRASTRPPWVTRMASMLASPSA